MELIKLPELGEGVTEGELIRWLVQIGDVVDIDQPVAEFMTDKATVEIPSPIKGKVQKFLVNPGQRVPVGAAILELINLGETVDDKEKSENASKAGEQFKQSPNSQGPYNEVAGSDVRNPNTRRVELLLPDLGEGVTEGELVRWLVQEGEPVQVDQAVAEFMTDKATVEVPSPYSGILRQRMITEGQKVPVKSVIAILDLLEDPSSQIQQNTKDEPNKLIDKNVENGLEESFLSVKDKKSDSSKDQLLPPADFRVLATPYTRRLARELGIDINQVKPTGLNGRVTRDDVLRAYEQMKAQTAGDRGLSQVTMNASGEGVKVSQQESVEIVPLVGIRRKIAENMKLSYSSLAHFTLVDEFCAQSLFDLRAKLKSLVQNQNVKLTYLPFIIKAVTLTLKEYPAFNATIDEVNQHIVYKKFYHVGVAVDTGSGLVVPVIRNADQKSIWEIAFEIQELATLARNNKLKPEQLKGSTFTITNLGAIGGLMATPIINYPESAILGVYRMYDKPVLTSSGQWQNQKFMHLSITADHRLIDGALAARFLNRLMGYLTHPEELLLYLK